MSSVTPNTLAELDAMLAQAPPALPPVNPVQQLEPFPPSLPLELALNTGPLQNILAAYDITPTQFKAILSNPVFRKEHEQFQEELKTEGFSFRQKAKTQAEAYLQISWDLATDPHTPAAVRADLIKQTVRWARLDPSSPGATTTPVMGNNATAEIINSLKDLPDHELEIQVMRIVSRSTAVPAPTYIDMEAAKLDVTDITAE